jgi:hypothetical protein
LLYFSYPHPSLLPLKRQVGTAKNAKDARCTI